MPNGLLSLGPAARSFGIPIAWLKAEALAGRIPCLQIRRQLFFDTEAVATALRERAATERVAQEVARA